MPDLDSGHIFLTTLAPIKTGRPEEGSSASYEQRVRIALARMPLANQSPATSSGEASKFNSPFARNTRTHLARMFVLDDVVYNGRITQNPLVAQIQGNNQIIPQKVDKLKTSYLVFCADIDAVKEDGDPLPTKLSATRQAEVRASYAHKLWETMEEELRVIYRNCYGFEGVVETGEDFAKYLENCHVETTMPFHDYYLELPKFNNLPIKALLYGVLAPFILCALALVLWLFGVKDIPLLGLPTLGTWIFSFVAGCIAALLAIRFAIKNGEKPLAPAKYDDLPSVLKSLYIQQNFADFYVDSQGKPDQELYESFQKFINEHKPDNRNTQTQKPGVISSRDPNNVITNAEA